MSLSSLRSITHSSLLLGVALATFPVLLSVFSLLTLLHTIFDWLIGLNSKIMTYHSADFIQEHGSMVKSHTE